MALRTGNGLAEQRANKDLAFTDERDMGHEMHPPATSGLRNAKAPYSECPAGGVEGLWSLVFLKGRGELAGQETSSMRWSAIRDQCLSSSGTEIWLTTCPSARFSIAQQRCGASIRNMVEHWHTVGDRK